VFQNIYKSSPRTKPQLNDWAPRVGFAWQPLSNGRLVVRGGGGIFYHMNSADDFYVPAARQAPYAVNVPRSGSANYFATLASPFDPTPVGWAPRWYTVNAASPNNITGLSSNLSFPQVQEVWKTPVAYQYNLSIQYEFRPNWVLDIGYVGSRAVHQYQSTSTDGVRYNAAQLASATNPINCGYDGNPTHCVTTTTTQNVFLRVPYMGYAPSAYKFGPNESGKYNSFQATMRKQFSQGLQFQAAYTFSRGFCTCADLTAPVLEYRGVNNATGNPIQSVYQPDQAYHPHRFVASWVWDLPLGHPSGFLGRVVTGWSVSGVATVQNGVPLTVTDATGATAFGNPLLGNLAQLSGKGPIGTSGGVSQRVDGYFNTAAFASMPVLNAPALGCGGVGQGTCGTGFGNSGYGILSGPGQNSYDISLSKMTTVGGIREGATLQFRAEFYNAFNHPQFTNPSGSNQTAFVATAASSFGKITSLSVNPRLVQFALKYTF
jgi:hypothetical protein